MIIHMIQVCQFKIQFIHSQLFLGIAISKGNTTKSDVDFFDSAFTFLNESIEVGCCARDTTLTNVTCGQGTSCIGQCSAIDASLCPSGNCTEDSADCQPNLESDEEEEEEEEDKEEEEEEEEKEKEKEKGEEEEKSLSPT